MDQIMVIGSGFMGAGIAQACAQSGYGVYLVDVNPQALDKAMDGIRWSLEKFSQKTLLTESVQTVLARISPEQDMRKAAEVSRVIEAVPEIEDLKKEIFAQLGRLAPAETLLATNTSSIPITHLAEVTCKPERVLGLHFFGPVAFMQLIEVIKGEKTSAAVFDAGVEFVRSLGKTPVKVHRDIPGFVMNRIFSAAFRECADLVADGIVSPEDVDVGMRLGYGWNIGPFEIADNAGLDTFLLVAKSMHALGEDYLVPRSDLIEKMVKQGRLGRKAGRGFYRYTQQGRKISGPEKE